MLIDISMKGIEDTWGMFRYAIYADHMIASLH